MRKLSKIWTNLIYIFDLPKTTSRNIYCFQSTTLDQLNHSVYPKVRATWSSIRLATVAKIDFVALQSIMSWFRFKIIAEI